MMPQHQLRVISESENKMTLKSGLGWDLAIKTGAVVQVWVSDDNVLEHIKILHSDMKGPSVKDPLGEICRYFELNILYKLTTEIVGYDRTLSIDWNPHEIYWGANKLNTNVKTFVAGYIFSHCNSYGINVEFTAPTEIRSLLGFHHKVSKAEVQRAFMMNVPMLQDAQKKLLGLTEHDVDAVILAYYAVANR